MNPESLPESTLIKHQSHEYRKEYTDKAGKLCVIVATVRHDDQCGNGHNTFSITGKIYDQSYIQGEASATRSDGKKVWLGSCGCIHEEISKHFPKLRHLLKWHLTSTDGPIHYVANTVYHAGNRDNRGLRAGERKQLMKGGTKQGVWERVARDEHGEKIKLDSWVDSEEKPQDTAISVQWEPVWIDGEGKERDLDAARSCAGWPEATDETLCLSRDVLTKKLLSRLPALMAEFKAAVESLGLTY